MLLETTFLDLLQKDHTPLTGGTHNLVEESFVYIEHCYILPCRTYKYSLAEQWASKFTWASQSGNSNWVLIML